MKNFFILLAGLLILSIQSCQVDAVTHFNKDYSGTSSTTTDLSGVMEMFGSLGEEEEDMNIMDSIFTLFDGTGNDSISMALDSMTMMMESVGMKDFDISRDGDYGIKLSFGFDDLGIFNGQDLMERMQENFDFDEEMMAGFNDNEMLSMLNNTTSVRKEGKWLIINLAAGYDNLQEDFLGLNEDDEEYIEEGEDEDEITDEEAAELATGMMKMMGGMFEINNTYTFDRKVKDVECNLPFTKDKHSVKLSYSLNDIFELIENDEKAELKIRLK